MKNKHSFYLVAILAGLAFVVSLFDANLVPKDSRIPLLLMIALMDAHIKLNDVRELHKIPNNPKAKAWKMAAYAFIALLVVLHLAGVVK